MEGDWGALFDILGRIFLFMFFILFVIVPIIHILFGIFLNKFNKLVYGEGSILAWFPVCNFYLLGKLTVGKYVVGFWVYFYFFPFFLIIINEYIPFPFLTSMAVYIFNLYIFVALFFFAFAIVKYFIIKRKKNNNLENLQQNSQFSQKTDNKK